MNIRISFIDDGDIQRLSYWVDIHTVTFKIYNGCPNKQIHTYTSNAHIYNRLVNSKTFKGNTCFKNEFRNAIKIIFLTLLLLVANFVNTKWRKKAEKWPTPWHMVLIWEYLARAFKWIPTWQGLDGFQKSLRSCASDESSLSIGRVKCY